MNEDQQKLEALWGFVRRFRPHIDESPLFAAIHDSFAETVAQEPLSMRNIRDVTNLIAKHGDGWVQDGPIFLPKVSGEWHITNSECEVWAEINRFGRRDYFPENWLFFENGITRAIEEKRAYQAYCRYVENGRLQRDHVLLLHRMRFEVDFMRGDWVSLHVQGKRPFGNSAREYDMLEVLNWPMPWLSEDEDDDADSEMPSDVEEKLWDLFDELPFAVYDLSHRALSGMFGDEVSQPCPTTNS